jgi:hypothetical protein
LFTGTSAPYLFLWKTDVFKGLLSMVAIGNNNESSNWSRPYCNETLSNFTESKKIIPAQHVPNEVFDQIMMELVPNRSGQLIS